MQVADGARAFHAGQGGDVGGEGQAVGVVAVEGLVEVGGQALVGVDGADFAVVAQEVAKSAGRIAGQTCVKPTCSG